MVEVANDQFHRSMFALRFLIEKGREIVMMVGLDRTFQEKVQCVALLIPLQASKIEIVDNSRMRWIGVVVEGMKNLLD